MVTATTTPTPFFTNPQVRRGRSGRRRRRRRRTGTTGPRSRRWCTPISARPAAAVSTCRSGGSSPSSTGCRAARSRRRSAPSPPGVTHLSQLDGRDDVIIALHDAMLDHAKPTPPRRLGMVDGEHYRRLLDDEYGVRRFWFKTATVTVDGVPWIIEVAVADTAKPGRTWFACNHAPAFGDPLGRTTLHAGDIYDRRRGVVPRGAGVEPHDHRAAVVHVICAATQFVDKGKVALVVPTPSHEAAAGAGRSHQNTAAGSRAAAQGRPQSRAGRAAGPRRSRQGAAARRVEHQGRRLRGAAGSQRGRRCTSSPPAPCTTKCGR